MNTTTDRPLATDLGTRPPGRPRDPRLDSAILDSAARQLGERGYAGMSLESVASAAGTTVPSLRRRYDAAVDMLVGACYARQIAAGSLPTDWVERVLATLWPKARTLPRTKLSR